MKDIKLEDVPKSKNILEHIEFTTDLTHGSGKEYGFNFCKLNKEIVVDKLCKGDECSIFINPTVCDEHDNFFHTHPNRRTSNLSVGDLVSSATRSHYSKKPNIVCAKAEFDDNVLCKKTDSQKFNITDVSHLKKKYKKGKPTFKAHKKFYDEIEKIIKPETVIFNSETGKLIYHHNKPKE